MTSQKTVFITGASSGIGYYLALEFARRGYKVFAGARRLDAMKPLTDHGIITFQLDITSTDSIENARELINRETGGHLDILYNNVGKGYTSSIFDSKKEEVIKTFDANVFSTLEVIRIFQKELISSKSTVCFTDSVAKHSPSPFAFAYAGSKAAFSYIAKVLYLEAGDLGIKVVNVITGTVDTPLWEADSDVRTPKDSIYYLPDDEVIKKIDIKRGPADGYSRDVVNKIEKVIKNGSSYTEFYAGGSTFTTWFLSTFFSFTFYKWILFKVLKIGPAMAKVKAKLEKKND